MQSISKNMILYDFSHLIVFFECLLKIPCEFSILQDCHCSKSRLNIKYSEMIPRKIPCQNSIFTASNNRNFTKLPGLEFLWKRLVSAEFLPILPKISGNCAFSQNLHSRKLAKIMVFYSVIVIAIQ